jgi:arylsulfatase A-like enzyme
MPGYNEWVRKNYPKNVEGLNHHLKNAIEEILESTERNAIIIIQSDHGSSLGLNPDEPSETDMLERFAILNAVFIPPKYSRQGLDQLVSSVNTFPVLLNNVFGLNIERLENRAFYSRGDLEFLDVTSRIRDY